MSREIRTCVDGLAFGEGPRWHDGALYISDMHDYRVLRIDGDGQASVVAQFDAPISGLGWLPDGNLLVVSMEDRRVFRQNGDEFVVHADLNEIATFHANDMIVRGDGNAYVGNLGFPIHPPGQPRPAVLARIQSDGTALPAANEMWFPNGMALTADDNTLIVAESAGFKLTAFDVDAAGALSNRRVWAQFDLGHAPDGICLDASGAAWVALPMSNEFVRVREGGEILERLPVEGHAIACVLGGADRRTLFMITSGELEGPKCRAAHDSKVLAVEVEVPGIGRP